jgi:hypothetical protein
MSALKGLNPYRKGGTAIASAAPVMAPQAPTYTGNGGWAMTASGAPANEELRGLDGGRMFGQQGAEMSAWDKKDAAKNLRHFAAQASSGELRRTYLDEWVPKNDRHATLVSAYHDQSGQKWAALGAGVAALIQQRQQREGFLRKVLNQNPLNQGEEPRLQMPRKIGQAVVAVSETSVEFQLVRNNRLYPTELMLTTNLRVANLELAQASGDLLEELYNQAYEGILVKEDRLLKAGWDTLATTGVNPTFMIGQGLTPLLLSQIKNQLTGQGLPPGTIVMASDYWDDLLGNAAFFELYDPVTRYNLIQDGTIGTIFGMPIITDTFRDPDFRVLNIGDMYVVAAPEFTGGFTDRGGVTATPVDGAQTGSSSKGWFVEEPFSLGLPNAKAVVKVQRTPGSAY